MKRNRKVQRLLQQHNIQQQNYSLIVRLKNIIQEQQHKIQHQQIIVSSFKKNSRNTKIKEMEIQIQHLHDQNQRLLLLIEENRSKGKTHTMYSSKKNINQSHKNQPRKGAITEFKVESKMGQILKENQNLRRQLLSAKVSQSFLKKRKSALNDRNNIFIEKNLLGFHKLQQQKLNLQAQNTKMHQKIQRLQAKVQQLSIQNQQLQNQNTLKSQQNPIQRQQQ